MKIVNLEQGSAEWLAWRRGGIGASEAPIILGDSPWKNPFQLYEEKLGKPRPAVHPRQAAAMQRGHDLEPKARALVEKALGVDLCPLCGEHDEHPWMRLSSDGASIDGAILTEIKAPGAKDHAVAQSGKVPPKYVGQLQHSLAVSGADVLFYASYRPEEDPEPILIEVRPDPEMQERLFRLEKAFWKAVQDQDWSVFEALVSDSVPDGFADLAFEWDDVSRQIAELTEREKRLRTALLSILPEGPGKFQACGIEVSRAVARGSIDYKKALAEFGIAEAQLEPFRKADSTRETIRRI